MANLLRKLRWRAKRCWGRLIGVDPIEVDRRLIARNNIRVRARCRRNPPKSVLLLLPYCLQWVGCPHRIVWNINNCHGCGRCTIKDLIGLADETGCELRISLSSYGALEIVRETEPDLTVAVACERELVDGIVAVDGRPAYCIFNQRPEGYCRNTTCDVDEVRMVLNDLLGTDIAVRPRDNGGAN